MKSANRILCYGRCGWIRSDQRKMKTDDSSLIKMTGGSTSQNDSAALDPFFTDAIRRSETLEHSGRKFTDHLLGTWLLLKSWGAPENVCRAGLYHSCYGTQFYVNSLYDFSERSYVRSFIGSVAEGLAYQFCTIDRTDLWEQAERMPTSGAIKVRIIAGGQRRLSVRNAAQILLIESANLAEQSAGIGGEPSEWLTQFAGWAQCLKRFGYRLPFGNSFQITRHRETRALKLYGDLGLEFSGLESKHLDEIIRLNPWVGEPRILRGLNAPQSGNRVLAYSDAAAGSNLLKTWSIAWDKRLRLTQWFSVADSVMRRAVGVSRQTKSDIDYDRIVEFLRNAD